MLDKANASYYNESPKTVSHLDLIPYTTKLSWSRLSRKQQSLLINASNDTLGLLLRDSPVHTLILNGQSVVDEFQRITGSTLELEEHPDWSLPRRSGNVVQGKSYKGTANSVAGIELQREVLLLGFNHNIQGSYGVTNEIIGAIGGWMAKHLESKQDCANR